MNLILIILIHRHGGLELVSGLENTLRSAERGISRVDFVRPLCRFRRRLALNARLSSRPIAFGAGFVLTVDRDSTAVVNVAPSSGGGVVQKIFESVLNGSRYLDVSFHQVMQYSFYYAPSTQSPAMLILDIGTRFSSTY